MFRSNAYVHPADAMFMTENGNPCAPVNDADAVAMEQFLACSAQGRSELARLIAVRLHAEQQLQAALGSS
jgi:hypothetical protein